jgi:4-amino-4-deoxy-L-arabinose transferase-like glycosyltransferase
MVARWAEALLLAGIVFCTRLPFVTHVLWEWDSVLYARAIEQGFSVTTDIADQRPHPPGYLFYVVLATAMRWIIGDSNRALVFVAVLASAAATAVVYLLARRFASRALAAFAALAFAFDPLVWAHSEIALPYIVLALGSTGLALLFWDARRGDDRQAVVAGAAFGLAAGFRQDLLLVLGPLWLWSVMAGGPRRVALGAAAVAVASLLWLVPSALLSGGLGAYLGAISAQSSTISGHSVAGAGVDVLWYDLRFVILALAWGLFAVGIVLLVLLLAPALQWIRRPRLHPPDEGVTFFLLWLIPGLAVYLLWIIGDWGYVLSVLPGMYVLCAALLARALAPAQGPALAAARVLLLGLLTGTVVFFVFGAGRWSQSALDAHDDSVSSRVKAVRLIVAPADAVLLAREDYLLARYYLAEYRAWLYDPAPPGAGDPPKRIGGTLVIFTPDLVLRQPVVGRTLSLGSTATRLVVVSPADAVKLFGVDPIAREP